MKVIATTLPRRSPSASRAPSWVVRAKAGAGPIFESRASAFASSPGAGADHAKVASTTSIATLRRTFERLTLSLQLLLQLVEEAPVGALGEDLLWIGPDHPGLVEPKRVEADGVLGVVLAPLVVGQLLHRLERVLVAGRVALVHKCAGHALRVERAQVRGLQDGAEGALGRDWIFSDKLLARSHEAAEVLRPRPIDRAVHQDMTLLFRAQFLRLRGKTQERVGLPLEEEAHRLLVGVRTAGSGSAQGGFERQPADVLAGIEPDVRGDRGEEDVLRAVLGGDDGGLSSEIADPLDPLGAS